MTHAAKHQKTRFRPFCGLTAKDVLCILALTLFFAALVFFRIGNTYAPQTSYTLTQEDRDIILDFGDYISVRSVSVYLNCLSDRHFALSAFNEVTRKWEVFNSDTEVSSVFAWNTMDINYKLRYLGIVSLDEKSILNEIVAQSPEGDVLLPVNAEKYPELFDEQEMFPGVSTYMDGTMFDEVYHGRTAYEFLHGLTTYETTHPHLGKILISFGILFFGMTPFGMRFMPAVFGILMVPLIYLFAKRLWKSTFCAAAVTSLLFFDCMHFTLSRISTIDIFAAFFILLMYYFMYCYIENDTLYRSGELARSQSFPPSNVYLPLALCGVSMGLGIAVKWTGVYAGAGLALLFLIHTVSFPPKKQTLRLFFFCCLFFILIPLVFYVLCFLPVVGAVPYKNLLDKVLQGTRYMFDYHANLVSTHYYSSPFYEWPILWMPLLDSCSTVGDAMVSAVSTMGNPFLYWTGIPCLLFVFFRAVFRRDRQAGFLSIAYLAQYVPWMLISRTTFIYHYFPSSIMMLLCIGYVMNRILCAAFRRKAGSAAAIYKTKAAITIYLVIAAGCFVLFYPVISGLPFPLEWGMRLRWLKDWILVL